MRVTNVPMLNKALSCEVPNRLEWQAVRAWLEWIHVRSFPMGKNVLILVLVNQCHRTDCVRLWRFLQHRVVFIEWPMTAVMWFALYARTNKCMSQTTACDSFEFLPHSYQLEIDMKCGWCIVKKSKSFSTLLYCSRISQNDIPMWGLNTGFVSWKSKNIFKNQI